MTAAGTRHVDPGAEYAPLFDTTGAIPGVAHVGESPTREEQRSPSRVERALVDS